MVTGDQQCSAALHISNHTANHFQNHHMTRSVTEASNITTRVVNKASIPGLLETLRSLGTEGHR